LFLSISFEWVDVAVIYLPLSRKIVHQNEYKINEIIYQFRKYKKNLGKYMVVKLDQKMKNSLELVLEIQIRFRTRF